MKANLRLLKKKLVRWEEVLCKHSSHRHAISRNTPRSGRPSVCKHCTDADGNREIATRISEGFLQEVMGGEPVCQGQPMRFSRFRRAARLASVGLIALIRYCLLGPVHQTHPLDKLWGRTSCLGRLRYPALFYENHLSMAMADTTASLTFNPQR
jgi:hypothetical protein